MRKWYPALVVGAAAAASAAVYGRLPERSPVHWNLAGEVDRYGSRLEAALLLPAMMLVLAALIPVLPKIDPRGANYEKFRPTYHLVMNAVLTFMLVVHGVLLAAALGHPVPVTRLVPVAIGLFLMLIGNVMPRTRPNWMFGIRTPWTLSSDRVWERTHRMGGYLLLAAGLVTLLSAALPDPRRSGTLMGAAIAAAALGSIVYSYVVWRQERRS